MKIKIKPILIPKDDPFKFDLLDRKKQSEILTSFLMQIETPYVMAIDGDWGSGKTTFTKMWKQSLEKKNFQIIYIDAWKSDYQNDPFIPIAKEIENHFKKNNGNKGKIKKYSESAKNVSKYLVKKSIPTLISVVTHGQLKLENAIEDSISNVATNISNDAIKEYDKQQKSLEKLQNNLTTLVQTENKEKPLIIIIDELDRCRPTYAIEFLERIKHFFATENIIFVLVVNQKQLVESLKSIYGSIDSEKYLTKFIDYTYKIPKPSKHEYIASLINKFGFNEFFDKRKQFPNLSYDSEQLQTMAELIFNSEKISLRDIEQILSHMMIVIKLTAENQFLFPSLVLFLIFIRRYDQKNYEKVKTLSNDPIVFIKDICKKHSFPYPENENELLRILALFEHSKKIKNYEYEVDKKYLALMAKDKTDFSSKVKDIISHYHVRMIGFNIVEATVKKIELLKPLIDNQADDK